MRPGLVITILAGLMLIAACGDPAANKPKAVTGQAAQVSSPTAAGQKYLITTQNSKIEWVASQVTGSHNGSFQNFSGEVDYAGAPEKSRVSVSIDSGSIQADDPKLTAHLKTPDFFDVAKFPKATFVSTEIKPGGESGATHTVTGNLTMHGVTKAVTFPATIAVTADTASVDANFSVNRKDFGINYQGPADNIIRDQVVLKLTIRAKKG